MVLLKVRKFGIYTHIVKLTHVEYEIFVNTVVCYRYIFFCGSLSHFFFSFTGFSLRPMNLSQEAITLVSYPGELFMRLLKLLILPLIISSLITATASANIRTNGRIAVRTLIYFALTTFLNVLLGISLVLIIHPGITGMDQNSQPVSSNNALSLMDNFLDLGR